MITAALILGLLGWLLLALLAFGCAGCPDAEPKAFGCGMLPITLTAVGVIVAALLRL